jgi:nucleoside-diphosphate-sugar epimerase
MRVFVTGASGHIGSAVVPELVSADHHVVALARSNSSAQTLDSWGAEVRRGDLDDLDGLREAAADADGVIHLAFKHDLMRDGDFMGAVVADLDAIKALTDPLLGTGKPFVGTGGTLALAGLGLGRPGTEDDVIPGGPRADAENYVIGLAGQAVRSSVVRLAPITHGDLDHHGFAWVLIAIARETGIAGYVGDGTNRWPAGYTLDAARLYRLALERAPAGSRLHANGEEGIPVRDIAETIGRHLGVPTGSIAPQDAPTHFGFLTPLIGLDNPTSNTWTQELLGWSPNGPGLLTDLDKGHYFAVSPRP